VTLCNKSAVSVEKPQFKILYQFLKIPKPGGSTGPYVERRSERIQRTVHSGTSSFWWPTLACVAHNMVLSGPDANCHHTRLAVRYIRNQEVNWFVPLTLRILSCL